LAEKLGLVQWAVDGSELEIFAENMATRLSAYSKLAIAECKKCIAAFLDELVDGYGFEIDGTRKLYENPESQRLVRSFLDKTGKS